MMPKGYGIGPSGKMQPIQPPAAGGGFGGMMPAPAGVAPQGGGLNPMSPGMPIPQGGGGTSVDTGGLPSGPSDGGGGFGQPIIYSPTFGGDTTNTYNRSYDSSSRNYDMSRRNTTNTNIDNSQTTMGQGQRVQRQKTKTQLNPFQSISPEMEQKMIGDPSRAMAQLRIMRGN